MNFLNGYLRTEGATDMMDSAMLAGILGCLDPFHSTDLRLYLYDKWGIVRCPERLNDGDWSQNPWNVTRDQLIPVIAGLVRQGHILEARCLCKAIEARGWRAQNTEADKPGSTKPWYNGADIFWGAEREFVEKILYGPTGKHWKLHLRILWHAYIQPMSEPNQLICMMVTAGYKYLNLWKYHNKNWRDCVRKYWLTGSRKDLEVCEFIISKIERL